MWFKNCQLFTYQDLGADSPESLHEQLLADEFQPCTKSASQSVGWVPALDAPEALLPFAANGMWLICLQVEDKILPAAVINQELQAQCAQIEKSQDRKLGRKERLRLKDEITYTMRARAFSKKSKLYGLIDTQNSWLIVDSTSAKVIDLFTSTLRRSLGGLKLAPPEIDVPLPNLSQWIQDTAPLAQFELGENCTLVSAANVNTLIRARKHNLHAATIQAFLQQHYEVQQLSLTWSENVSFNLKNDLSISGITYLESVKAMTSDIFTETPEQRFDADFLIMTEILRGLIRDLLALITLPASTGQHTPELEEATAN